VACGKDLSVKLTGKNHRNISVERQYLLHVAKTFAFTTVLGIIGLLIGLNKMYELLNQEDSSTLSSAGIVGVVIILTPPLIGLFIGAITGSIIGTLIGLPKIPKTRGYTLRLILAPILSLLLFSISVFIFLYMFLYLT
tara:strand:+ start:415 stop:828 length:414 start_codon:yes stop_codon:yes gene_type:complete